MANKHATPEKIIAKLRESEVLDIERRTRNVSLLNFERVADALAVTLSKPFWGVERA
jgi:hypothetical protein